MLEPPLQDDGLAPGHQVGGVEVAEAGGDVEGPPGRRAPAPPQQVPAERVPVACLHGGVGALQPVKQPVEQVLQAQHVLAVVLERGLEVGAPARAQIVEVGLRDQVAGHVVLPLESQQPLLDRAQGAGLESRPEQASDQVQEVEVAALRQLAGHPRHQPPRAQ